MYLLVKASGRYWRMDYTHADKRKTLALGVYPEVSLAKARKRREEARELLAEGLDPSAAKKAEKLATRVAAANTFEAVAREFHATQASGWSPRYAARWIERMEKDLFPYIGKLTLPAITAPVLLDALRKAEKRGANETAHTLRQTAGQVFRYCADRALRAQPRDRLARRLEAYRGQAHGRRAGACQGGRVAARH